MASFNQLISEIAHSIQQADSIPVRNAIRLSLIHARNELIRQNYENHHYIDKTLQQRFRIKLIDIPDGDIKGTEELDLIAIKRSEFKVPRPVRLTNNLPFHSIRTAGSENPTLIPYVREGLMQYYAHLPGMTCLPCYDIINDYLYINGSRNVIYNNLEHIVIEGVFERPYEIPEANINDDDELMFSEDMVGTIKKLVLETFNAQIARQTNEIPTPNLMR